jgi:SAM-dependent methyltransferase
MNSLVKHYEDCFRKHGDNHKGVDWPDKEGAEQRYRIMLDVLRLDITPPYFIPSFLDYGCGLGHMYEYIKRERILCGYMGYDLSEVFVEECRKKFPEKFFYSYNPPATNYVVMNGVFTERIGMTETEALTTMVDELHKAWHLCDRGMAFNVMNDSVSKERLDLLRVPLRLLEEIIKGISSKYIIRCDYKQFETTAYVYR